MAIRARLPYPPTVNLYWRIGNGRIYISDRGRQYQRRVSAILSDAPEQPGRLSVAVSVYPPDRRKRDLDNVLKCLLDSITRAGVWQDDSVIDRLLVERRDVKTGGMVEVVIDAI